MWSHIAKFPERQKNSNRAMKAQSFDGVWSVGLFPFAEKIKELGKEADVSTPLVVDIGGGAGHTSAKIRELCKVSQSPFVPFTILKNEAHLSDTFTNSVCGLGFRVRFPTDPWSETGHGSGPYRPIQKSHRYSSNVSLCTDCVLELRVTMERLFYKTSQR